MICQLLLVCICQACDLLAGYIAITVHKLNKYINIMSPTGLTAVVFIAIAAVTF